MTFERGSTDADKVIKIPNKEFVGKTRGKNKVTHKRKIFDWPENFLQNYIMRAVGGILLQVPCERLR